LMTASFVPPAFRSGRDMETPFGQQDRLKAV
jgi:hypothetical protein